MEALALVEAKNGPETVIEAEATDLALERGRGASDRSLADGRDWFERPSQREIRRRRYRTPTRAGRSGGSRATGSRRHVSDELLRQRVELTELDIERAHRFRKRGRYEESRERIDRALRRSPNDERLLQLRRRADPRRPIPEPAS